MNRRVVWLALMILLAASVSALSANLTYLNGTPYTLFSYDRVGSLELNASFGSDSFMDGSRTNPPALISLCHPDLEEGLRADLVYETRSRNLSGSILTFLPQIYSTYASGPEVCTTMRVDLASVYALYPGYVFAHLPAGNATVTTAEPIAFLNGSFSVGVSVIGPPKQYLISVQKAFDEDGVEITRNRDRLLTSVVDADNETAVEGRLFKGEPILFNGSFQGGEQVIINGIQSLEIKLYDPCDPINESGYYLVNNSIFNGNESCIVIENLDNIALNFVGEILDGDNQSPGSLDPDTCPIRVVNSRNVTLENLRTQEFAFGLCVSNSTLNVFGDASVHNLVGAIIDNASTVHLIDMAIHSNNDTDIIVQGGSLLEITNVTFGSANISGSFRDVMLDEVPDPPTPPEGLLDAGQFISIAKGNVASWAQVSFHYMEPMPNDVVTNNISVYKYNGTYESFFVPVGNESVLVTNWTNGTWEQIFTLISPSQNLIVADNVSDFSVFAPLGFTSNDTQPDPEPQPQPQPQAGSSSGGGGTPSTPLERDIPIFPDPILLVLELPENITLRQGEAGDVPFNLSNIGNTTANNISIRPVPLSEWDYTNWSLDTLAPGQNRSGDFQLGIDLRTVPNDYYIPVDVWIFENGTETRVLREILKVRVLPRGDLARLRVVEYPPVIEIAPGTEIPVSFLIQNIGDLDLAGVTVQFDPTRCLRGISGSNDLAVDEQKVFTYRFLAGEEGVCDYNIKFYQDGRLVGFVPVTLLIRPPFAGLSDAAKWSVLLAMLAFWTILTVHIVARKRYGV